MKIKIIPFLTLAIFMLSGCASPYVALKMGDTNAERIYAPKIGVQSKVNLGDSMMLTGQGWYVDCLVPNFEYALLMPAQNYKLTVKTGEKLCADSEGGNYFTAPYEVLGPNVHPGMSFRIWSVEDIGGGLSKWCANRQIHFCHERPKTDYKIVKSFKQAADEFQQSIEYSGRNGDILSFTYAEFNEKMARTAFNRNFQVDLKEGNTVNYKGAEIEIIEADNRQVTYIIKEYFSGK